jgi:UDP-N-acetyl-2-amino-2-deoxyglucuronate dehydrogenase
VNFVQGNTVKVGIVGAGKIVEDAHLPVLRTLPGVSISWITDQQPDRSNLLADMYQIPAVAPEVALQRIPQIDVCLIAIPFGARRDYLKTCMQHGKAAYVEKPFARSEADHLAIMSGLPPHQLAVGFQRREYQAVQTLRGIINSGMLGQLQSVRLTEANFTLKSGGASSFRNSAESAGGGVTIESSIHSLDLIQYVTSATDVETSHVKSIVRAGIDFQMQCESRLTLPGNHEVPVSIFISRLKNLTDAFQFHFEHAVVDLPPKPQFPLLIKPLSAGTNWHSLIPSGPVSTAAININAAFVLFWDHFLTGLREKQPNLTSAASSVITSRWIDQIYGSMTTG